MSYFSLQYSIKWLPKSPKLYGSRNWSSQSSRWASLRGKESVHGGNLYKFNSDNEKWKEGRVSPEQEAEELEDPDEDVSSQGSVIFNENYKMFDLLDFFFPMKILLLLVTKNL